MSDEEAAPPATDSAPPEGPPDRSTKESRRRLLEGVIPEIVRRAVELGVEKAQVAPDNLKQFVVDMKLPKEIAQVIFHQIDETKNGLFRVVAKELRDFLEHTNFAGELQKLLTTVQFEVNTTIRFTPNDKKAGTERADEPAGDGSTDAGAREAEPSSGGDEPARGARPSSRPSTLPKPEVTTAVHVRRDDRERRRRRDGAV